MMETRQCSNCMTTRELKSLQHVKRFDVLVYLLSWYTSVRVVDASVNDMLLIERRNKFDDTAIKTDFVRTTYL
jgi:hypothetical protein